MKMKFKILSVVMCLVSVFGAGVYGCADGELPTLPDYSAAADDYEFFAYTPNTSGRYSVNGVERVLGPDMRTVEGYTDYKNAGFDILMLTGNNGYHGGGWEGSVAETCARTAEQAGITKILLNDTRINSLVENKDALVGENGRFATQEELTAYVKSCMEDYAAEENLYGIQVRDEPDYTYTKAVGEVYRAIKAAAAELGLGDIFINLNLLPLSQTSTSFAKDPENLTDAYTSYVNNYLDATGADRICCDVYLFRDNGLCSWFYQTVQIIRKACDERGVEMSFCLQSFELYSGTTRVYRGVGRSEMFMEIYSLMGFGVDQFAYYTYHIPTNYINGFPDNRTFINLKGEKNNVYYYGQAAMTAAQKMSDVILNYDFKGAKFFFTDKVPTFGISDYITSRQDTVTGTAAVFDNSYEFAKLKSVEFDNDVVFATELYDDENDLYMYMLQNVIDPADGVYGRTSETVSADFGSEYVCVAELCDGKLNYVRLDNGVYSKTLSAGSAVFLVPLK